MDPLDPANVCVHLTGIGPTACHAGVDYDSVKAGTRRPEWPCTNLAVPCAARLLPAAQLAANQKWFDELAEQGVRIVHPDDGWVDHEANTIRFVYPTMQHALPAPGVLVALGTRERWRVVMLTREVLQPVGMSSLWAWLAGGDAIRNGARWSDDLSPPLDEPLDRAQVAALAGERPSLAVQTEPREAGWLRDLVEPAPPSEAERIAAHVAAVAPGYRERARAWLDAEHADMVEDLAALMATVSAECCS